MGINLKGNATLSRRIHTIAAGVGVLTVLSGAYVISIGYAADAQAPQAEPSARFEQMFSRLDKDGNGQLTQDEVNRPQMFEHLDANKDGVITLEEAKAARGAMGGHGKGHGAKMFEKFDANGDGMLSKEEFPRQEAFEKIDADGNGFLTIEELRAAAGKMMGAGREMTPEQRAAMLETQFAKMDANGDGKLHAQEFPRQEAFAKVDVNGDGFITLDEMKAAAGKMGRHGQRGNHGDHFKAMDKDGDGKLSAQEFPRPDAFAKIDANSDGFITTDEMQAVRAKMGQRGRGQHGNPEQRFAAMDKDGNGVISRDEFPRAELFDRLDANKDGNLTKEELQAAAQRRK